MFDPPAILAQVSHNEAQEGWLVRRAKDSSRITALLVGIFVAIVWVPMFTIVTLIIAFPGSLSSPNSFPVLLQAPWLVLPALFLSATFVYTAWHVEKNKGDAVLVLLPEGIIECEHWSHVQKRRIKSFEYANLEKITLKVGHGTFSFSFPSAKHFSLEETIPDIQSGELVFDIVYRDGRRGKWSVANKYLSKPGDILLQHIVTDYASHVQLSKEVQVIQKQASSKSQE